MKTKSNSPLAPLAVGFFIGILVVGTAVVMWRHDAPSDSHSHIPTYAATAPLATSVVADSAVTRIAARFACSCGTCGEKRLDICSCETAQQERAFLQEQLRNGRNEAEAVEALNKKYGGLKS